MNNKKGFTKKEWEVILPVKLQIRKEFKDEGFRPIRIKHRRARPTQ